MKKINWFLCQAVVLFFIFYAFILIFPSTSHAQSASETSFGVAHFVPIADKDVKDGSIVSISKNAYIVSKTEYDTMVIGVVAQNPAVVINIDVINKYPVISEGHAFVRVSTVNGPIKKGDLITSSSVTGVAMKATRSGYVIGSAFEDFTSKNTKEIGKIDVVLSIHYFSAESRVSTSLMNILNLTAIATYEQPTVVFRYFLAGLLILIAFVLGLFSFGRIANTGIEALGRNPMASRMIQLGILLNVLITISIIAAGLAIAYFVLRL